MPSRLSANLGIDKRVHKAERSSPPGRTKKGLFSQRNRPFFVARVPLVSGQKVNFITAQEKPRNLLHL